MTAVLLAYGGLFLWSFLASTVVPLGGDLPVVAIVRAERQVIAPVLVATLGNYLGACTTYWLGGRAAAALNEKHIALARDSRSARLLERYGQPVLLLSWLPIIGDALVALAGGLGIPFGRFSLYVIVGKVLRYSAVAWAAYAI
ncbi:MAG: YqaA family protein [Gemmatimonadota bacterium]